jgi:hypothetical protein
MEEVNIERPTSNIEVEESEEVTSALASSPGRATRLAAPNQPIGLRILLTR